MSRSAEDTAETMAVETQGESRLRRLESALASVRSRGGMDTERMQLIAGSVLVLGGLVAILIGWFGTAKTGFLFEQVPYLVSGGLLGLALVVLGGFVYFSFWVTRLLNETRQQSQRAADQLEQISELLTGAAASNGSRTATTGRQTFVATKSGSQFHRPDCPAVAGRKGLRRISSTRGMKACRICSPLDEEEPG